MQSDVDKKTKGWVISAIGHRHRSTELLGLGKPAESNVCLWSLDVWVVAMLRILSRSNSSLPLCSMVLVDLPAFGHLCGFYGTCWDSYSSTMGHMKYESVWMGLQPCETNNSPLGLARWLGTWSWLQDLLVDYDSIFFARIFAWLLTLKISYCSTWKCLCNVEIIMFNC